MSLGLQILWVPIVHALSDQLFATRPLSDLVSAPPMASYLLRFGIETQCQVRSCRWGSAALDNLNMTKIMIAVSQLFSKSPSPSHYYFTNSELLSTTRRALLVLNSRELPRCNSHLYHARLRWQFSIVWMYSPASLSPKRTLLWSGPIPRSWRHKFSRQFNLSPTSPAPEKAKLPMKGWKWERVATLFMHDENGTLHFPDLLKFKPSKMPQEILQQGDFGNSHFWSFRCQKGTWINGTKQCCELPASETR